MKAKRSKRIFSCLMAFLIMACAVPATGVFAQETDNSTYDAYLESVTPENNYGLTDTVNEGKILQAWNWSYKNTIDLMEQVAQQGFTTIQVSPPNEIKMPTKGVKVCEPKVNGVAPNGWWMFYQPAGFQLNESEDNALGTKAEFVEMCKEAKKYGIKILVDAVINHMGTDDDHIGEYTNDSTDPMDHVNERAKQFEPELIEAKAFHYPWKNMTYVENLNQQMPQYYDNDKPILDANGNYVYGGCATEYDIEESLTQHCTSGLPDLATETELVQETIYDYLKELILAGADGFRFDAAKHIETSNDTYFKSDFWENTLLKLRAEYPDKEIYAYGEILNTCGDGRPFSEYTALMDVTDSRSYWRIKNMVVSNGTDGVATPRYPNENFTKENVIQWNESHDTYIDGGTSALTVEQRNRIWALTGARQEITGVYFARPDDRAGDKEYVESICTNITLGDANITSWANEEVQAVNRFDNFFGSADEYCRTKDNVAIIERFDKDNFLAGATLVNLQGLKKDVSLSIRNLPDGKYVDAITGNEFTVSEGKLTGSIGLTGIACIYSTDEEIVFPEISDTEPTMAELQALMEIWDASGGVYPTVPGANTVVFSANDWTTVNVYSWISGTEDNLGNWPGNPMVYALKNGYNQNQYYTMIPVTYDCYIVNNGGNEQTVDLYVTDSEGMYLANKEGDKYNIGKWNPDFDDLTTKEFYELIGKESDTSTGTTETIPTSAPEKPLLGDANTDGNVTIKDVTTIQKVLALIEVESYSEEAADVDASGKVNIKDATFIQKWIADIETGYDIGSPIK